MLSVASLAFSLRLRDAVEDMVMRRRRVAFASVPCFTSTAVETTNQSRAKERVNTARERIRMRASRASRAGAAKFG